jgi:hypothetical protein
METLRAALCAGSLATLFSPVQAGTHWLCTVSGSGTQLGCLADVNAADASTTTGAPVETTALVNGTRFPLDPARRYTVEMWSPPTEADFVALLARATICYRGPGCQVTLAPGPRLATTGQPRSYPDSLAHR